MPAGGAARGRWGAAVALAAAVLLFSVFEAFPLVALPLAVLLLAFPARPLWIGLGIGLVVWALLVTPYPGALASVSRGWALGVAGVFVAGTIARPRWSFFSRALLAVASVFAVVGAWLVLTGAWSRVDWVMGEHFRSVSALAGQEALLRLPESGFATNFAGMGARMAELQGEFFPALLALQSLAALALAWWAWARTRARFHRVPALRPLRDFRFNDQLVWVLVVGLLLVLFPFAGDTARIGYNLLLFMGALYALRGVAVFVFLARGAPTATSVVLGAFAAIFLYPLVFTAALLVGLGDTWLDVRGRATAVATRA